MEVDNLEISQDIGMLDRGYTFRLVSGDESPKLPNLRVVGSKRLSAVVICLGETAASLIWSQP